METLVVFSFASELRSCDKRGHKIRNIPTPFTHYDTTGTDTPCVSAQTRQQKATHASLPWSLGLTSMKISNC